MVKVAVNVKSLDYRIFFPSNQNKSLVKVKSKSVKTTDDDDEYTTVIKVRLVKFCKFQVNLFSG
jgi:hypothetical protein